MAMNDFEELTLEDSEKPERSWELCPTEPEFKVPGTLAQF